MPLSRPSIPPYRQDGLGSGLRYVGGRLVNLAGSGKTAFLARGTGRGGLTREEVEAESRGRDRCRQRQTEADRGRQRQTETDAEAKPSSPSPGLNPSLSMKPGPAAKARSGQVTGQGPPQDDTTPQPAQRNADSTRGHLTVSHHRSLTLRSTTGEAGVLVPGTERSSEPPGRRSTPLSYATVAVRAMDPMDYTMDDAAVGNQGAGNQGNQANDATSHSRQIQCQDPSRPQAQSTHPARSREARHYDPVHDSSSPWAYPANGNPHTHAPFRSPYAAPPSQPWPVPTFVPGNNWLGSASTGRPTFGDFSTGRPSFGDLPRDNGPAAASGVPDLPPFPGRDARPDFPVVPLPRPSDSWAAFQERYSAWPGSFDNYAAALTRNTAYLPTPSSSSSSSRPSLRPADQGHQQRGAVSQPVHAHLRVPSEAPPRSFHPPNFFEGAADLPRNTYPRLSRGTRIAARAAALYRQNGLDTDLFGRQPWESDEESTSDAELDARRRERDAAHREIDDERAMGAMRAALSAGKRLPTKIALASLETLNVDNLQGEEKSKPPLPRPARRLVSARGYPMVVGLALTRSHLTADRNLPGQTRDTALPTVVYKTMTKISPSIAWCCITSAQPPKMFFLLSYRASRPPQAAGPKANATLACIICYNEFGISNPEGQVEQPTRLPRCKHVFGDICIKKWFEDSDSCPYCRDKLPSELKRLNPGPPITMRMVHSERERMRARWEAQILAQQGLLSGFYNENSSARRASATPQATAAVSPYQQNTRGLQQMPRHTDGWDEYVPQNPGRYTPGDYHPDRRRQARGRLASGRAGHPGGRPTSVGGSARSNMQPVNLHQGSPRHFGAAAHPTPVTGTSRRATAIPRSSATHPQTPQNRASNHSPLSSSPHSPEAASPAVAVGSGVSASGRSGAESNAPLPRFGPRSSDTNPDRQQSQNPWEGNEGYGQAFVASAATMGQTASPEAPSRYSAQYGEASTGGEGGLGGAGFQLPSRWSP
ncbi:hypothetical protein B2J93_2624 [Marssonina coronariae]|uniref:RING-type domain-containing protein n=1 Tax=Diplocarpon coronariae TaxID=2795749 RepID=A0A218Z6T6_9HELO|nr:hypothetical protein B2J93_2624 [Marssonina coronariae]